MLRTVSLASLTVLALAAGASAQEGQFKLGQKADRLRLLEPAIRITLRVRGKARQALKAEDARIGDVPERLIGDGELLPCDKRLDALARLAGLVLVFLLLGDLGPGDFRKEAHHADITGVQ